MHFTSTVHTVAAHPQLLPVVLWADGEGALFMSRVGEEPLEEGWDRPNSPIPGTGDGPPGV